MLILASITVLYPIHKMRQSLAMSKLATTMHETNNDNNKKNESDTFASKLDLNVKIVISEPQKYTSWIRYVTKTNQKGSMTNLHSKSDNFELFASYLVRYVLIHNASFLNGFVFLLAFCVGLFPNMCFCCVLSFQKPL